MKALVYRGAKRMDYCDAPDAAAGDGEALVRVAVCGVCGSDMHGYLGHDPRRVPPLILGHEAAGVVAQAGGDKFPVGARVVVNPLVTCGACEWCLRGRENICAKRELLSLPPREGAFAELVAVPESNLTAVPEGFAMEKAALAEPLACGFHAVRVALEGLFPERRPASEFRAVVLGGGGIGWGAALNLRAAGVSEVVVAEPNDLRRAALVARGEFSVVHPDGLRESFADVVVDAVGISATREKACAVAAAGGRIVHIGLGSGDGGVDARRMTLWEIALAGVYTYTADDFAATAELMFAGKLGDLDWAEVRPLSEGAGAFADILEGRASSPKIALEV